VYDLTEIVSETTVSVWLYLKIAHRLTQKVKDGAPVIGFLSGGV
jgi:hypothetical protein